MGLWDDNYECKAKGCQKDNLCVGCVYSCAVCADEFCFDHVKDVAPEGEPEARYLCLVCAAKIVVLEVAA